MSNIIERCEKMRKERDHDIYRHITTHHDISWHIMTLYDSRFMTHSVSTRFHQLPHRGHSSFSCASTDKQLGAFLPSVPKSAKPPGTGHGSSLPAAKCLRRVRYESASCGWYFVIQLAGVSKYFRASQSKDCTHWHPTKAAQAGPTWATAICCSDCAKKTRALCWGWQGPIDVVRTDGRSKDIGRKKIGNNDIWQHCWTPIISSYSSRLKYPTMTSAKHNFGWLPQTDKNVTCHTYSNNFRHIMQYIAISQSIMRYHAHIPVFRTFLANFG